MSMIDRLKRHDVHLAHPPLSGPHFAFLGSIIGIAALWYLADAWLHRDLVIPMVSTAALALAAGFALLAHWHRTRLPSQVSYGDVAGALVLVGLCAAATIEPDQFVRTVLQETAER
jgi:hypothetical protein